MKLILGSFFKYRILFQQLFYQKNINIKFQYAEIGSDNNYYQLCNIFFNKSYNSVNISNCKNLNKFGYSFIYYFISAIMDMILKLIIF